MSIVMIIFYLLSAITLGTAFLAIYSKNPIHSAIWLVVSFFSIAGHYLLLNAQFLALVHIIVYSGAIMILFLFTIMLMNLSKENEKNKPILPLILAGVLLVAVGAILVTIFMNAQPTSLQYAQKGADFQSIKVLGKVLLDKEGFMVPFEFASILLLVGMIGAVLLSKKENSSK